MKKYYLFIDNNRIGLFDSVLDALKAFKEHELFGLLHIIEENEYYRMRCHEQYLIKKYGKL